jgi:small GTP-binding protein
MSRPVILKAVLLGDGGVGKSSLMQRFVNNTFDSNHYHTIGVEFLTKELVVDDVHYTLQIWDTAGQERFKSLRTPFYRGTDCCMLVYAVDDERSFLNLSMWQKEFFYYADVEDQESFPFVIVGNKVDVDDARVDPAMVRRWCQENGDLKHFETSAKTATNVEQAFHAAVKTLVEKNRIELSSDKKRTDLSNGFGLENQITVNRTGGCCR